jgi:hypothetical protein
MGDGGVMMITFRIEPEIRISSKAVVAMTFA